MSDVTTLAATELTRVTGHGPLRGLGGLTVVELRRWFPWRALVFVAVGVGWGLAMFALWLAVSADGPRLTFFMYPFFAVWSALLILVMVATAQGAMANEIEEGTAAWVVAKPVGRPAFVLSKFLAAIPGVVLGAIVLPGIVGRLLLERAEARGDTEFPASELLEVVREPDRRLDFTTLPDVARYAGTLAILAAILVFLVALMILLGCVIESRAAIFLSGLAVPGLLLAYGRLGQEAIVQLTPAWAFDSLIEAIADNPAPVLWPVVVTLVWSLGIVGVAMWWFSRKEL